MGDEFVNLQMLAPSQYVWMKEDPTRYYYVPVLGWLYRNRIIRCLSLLPEGNKILEVGYGSGVSFLNLGDKYKHIHGIDLHDRNHEVHESFRHTDLHLNLQQGNVFSLPYEDDTFDSALAISIHEHLKPEDQKVAFSEILRVLKPGGCYVVGVPGFNIFMLAAFGLMGWNIRKYHLSTEKQVLASMHDQFAVDTTMYHPSLFPRSMTTYLCIRGWKQP